MNLRLIPKAKPKVRLAPKPPQSKTWNAADDVFLDANRKRQAVKASFGKRALMDPVPRTGEGPTYDKAKAEGWAKQGYKVVSRDNANGRSYSRTAVHPNVPTKTRQPRYGAGLGEKIKTRLVGRKTLKPDYTRVQYERGSGKIEDRVYQSRAVYRANKRKQSVAKGLPSALRGRAISYETKGVGPSWVRNKIRRTMDGQRLAGPPDMTNNAVRSQVTGAKATKTRSNTLLNTGGRLSATKGRVLP